ncbi:IMPACT family protein [Halalkalibaculum sp. DA3122]|uniref:IMPACT family protein n=1 Tax=unclassified Halalkalibaculum TaxID=2964617 RepID=UPI003754218C
MKTVAKQTTASFREKGSKFIGHLFPSETKDEFSRQLSGITSRYPDATHHCYAYRVDPTDPQEFAQDDGEPRGTAGLPILNQLKSAELVNAGLVVVRYYGGTNLGTSGLIEAYGHTARCCAEKADLFTLIPTLNIELRYPYHRQNEIDQLASSFDLTELDATYLAAVTLVLASPLDKSDQLTRKLDKMVHLEIQYEILGESFVIHQ